MRLRGFLWGQVFRAVSLCCPSLSGQHAAPAATVWPQATAQARASVPLAKARGSPAGASAAAMSTKTAKRRTAEFYPFRVPEPPRA